MKIFHLPDLGEGLAEAEIREWYVKVGDVVHVDQPLVSMETAKAVVDVPSPYAGKIIELHGTANSIVQTGAPLITFETGEAASGKTKNTVVGALEESTKKWDESQVIIGTASSSSSSIKAMPAARVLAKQMNVDLHQITPSGPQGLITPEDVKQWISSHSPTERKIEGAEALHGVRRAMALAMADAHREVALVTIVDEADITDFPLQTDLTVHLLKAIVAAAKAEPSLNAWFDGKKIERKLWHDVNIGLAVDTPEGLFVPVIKNAEKCSTKELRQHIDAYKISVRDRSILPANLHGATITLSNFGMIAGRYATPIIVPPTVAILGCGRSREAVLSRQGQVVTGRLLPLSLSFDHRAVTGGEATRFLGAVIHYLSQVQ